MDNKRVHLWIRGDVQGIGFRVSAQMRAQAAGLKGWVRNRADGSVEAVIEGEAEAVNGLVRWCHHGPPGAFVSGVDTQLEPFSGTFNRFSIAW